VIARISNVSNKIRNGVIIASAYLYMGLAYADSVVDVTNFSGTNGSGGKKIDDVLASGKTTLQNTLNFFCYGCVALGLVTCATCWYKMQKAAKDDGGGRNEKPWTLILGMIIGGGLTCVGALTGYFANTINAASS